jgi:hypothetical protein
MNHLNDGAFMMIREERLIQDDYNIANVNRGYGSGTAARLLKIANRKPQSFEQAQARRAVRGKRQRPALSYFSPLCRNVSS